VFITYHRFKDIVDVELASLYRNFGESIKSDATKKQYNFYLQKYIQHIGGTDNLLRQNEAKLIESQILDYIVKLKTNHNSWSYLAGNLAAILHFYTMNDILLNKKKIKMFTGTKNKKFKDKGYTTEQIAKVLEFCDDRTKLIVLLFASTGIRLAALPPLKLKHWKAFSPSTCQLTIYEGEPEEYTTFCTPECIKAADVYLSYRTRSGEVLTPNSPLIREQYDENDAFRVHNPKHVNKSTLGEIIAAKLRHAGIRDITHVTELSDRSKNRKDVPLIHGFRKFFNTALMNADVHPSFKKLLMGHSVQLDEVYYDKQSEKSQAKLLEEYSKAIDYLTINEENRLRKKVEVLKAKRDEIEMLKGQVQQKDDRLSVIEKQMQSLVSTLSKLTEQGQVNTVAQTLYSSGILKEGKEATNQ
jgi:integrase